MTEKKKFNFFDLFILVIIALLVVGVLWFMGRGGGDAGQNCKINYVVEVSSVTEDRISSPQVGDKVLDSVGKSEIGVISAVDTVPYTYNIYNTLTGKLENVEMEGYYNVRLTIDAYADVTDAQISVNNFRVAVGKEVNVQSKHFVGTGYCLSINQITEEQ